MSIEQSSTGPASVIGFFFGCRIILLVVCVRLLDWDPQPAVAFTLALNYLCVPLAIAQPGSSRGFWTQLWRPPNRWALAFLVISGASLFWTVADSFSAACAFWLGMAADALTVLLLVQKDPTRHEQASALMRGFVYGACLVSLIAWILPSQSDLRLGDEELLGPNQIGFLCATALFFAQHQLRRGHATMRVLFGLLFLTLLRSLSKTSILAFLSAEMLLLIRDRSLSRRSKVVLWLAAMCVLTLFAQLFFNYVDVYLNLGNQSVTLSGRLSIWAYILDEAFQARWLGHGFHSVWKVIPPLNGDFLARHAHNELLQQFYAYGVLGIVVLIGYYGSFVRTVRRIQHPSVRALLLSLTIFFILRGLTDTEVFDLSLPCWAMILWTAVLAQPVTHPLPATPPVPEPRIEQTAIVTPLSFLRE